MTQTLYLHVGMPKTGTTALQWFFDANYDLLRTLGICCPRAGRSFPFLQHRFGHVLRRSLSERGGSDLAAFLDSVQSEAGGLSILISDEGVLFPHDIPMEHVRDALHALCDHITIVIYLRRQDQWLQSAIQQCFELYGWQKQLPSALAFDDIGTGLPPRYSLLLNELARVFGSDNVVVRSYGKGEFAGGSVFADFCSIVGFPLTQEFSIPQDNVNPSLPLDCLDFLAASTYFTCANHPIRQEVLESLDLALSDASLSSPAIAEIRLGWKLAGVHHSSPGALRRFADSMHAETFRPHTLLSPSDRMRILEVFAEDNANVARKYLRRPDGVLFRDPPPDPNEPWAPTTLHKARIREIAAFIKNDDAALFDELLSKITPTTIAAIVNDRSVATLLDFADAFYDVASAGRTHKSYWIELMQRLRQRTHPIAFYGGGSFCRFLLESVLPSELFPALVLDSAPRQREFVSVPVRSLAEHDFSSVPVSAIVITSSAHHLTIRETLQQLPDLRGEIVDPFDADTPA